MRCEHVVQPEHVALTRSFSAQTVSTAQELRRPVYRGVAVTSIDYDALLQQMALVKWDVKDIMSQHSAYVDVLLQVSAVGTPGLGKDRAIDGAIRHTYKCTQTHAHTHKHTHTHTQMHTHTQTHAGAHTHTRAHKHTHSHTYSLTHSLTHRPACLPSLSLSVSHTHCFSLSHSHTHTPAHSLSLHPSVCLSISPSPSLSPPPLSLSLSLTHTHTHTHTSLRNVLQELSGFNQRLSAVSRRCPVPKEVTDVLWEHCIKLSNRTFVEGSGSLFINLAFGYSL